MPIFATLLVSSRRLVPCPTFTRIGPIVRGARRSGLRCCAARVGEIRRAIVAVFVGVRAGDREDRVRRIPAVHPRAIDAVWGEFLAGRGVGEFAGLAEEEVDGGRRERGDCVAEGVGGGVVLQRAAVVDYVGDGALVVRQRPVDACRRLMAFGDRSTCIVRRRGFG